jgi:Cdc6-like AAA superfamily ATPase
MMRIFKRKARSTQQFDQEPLTGAIMTATAAAAQDSAEATFSNPFGLAENETAGEAVVENLAEFARRSNGFTKGNGIASEPAGTGQPDPTPSRQGDEPCDLEAKSAPPMAQLEQVGDVAVMPDESLSRRSDLSASLWGNVTGESLPHHTEQQPDAPHNGAENGAQFRPAERPKATSPVQAPPREAKAQASPLIPSRTGAVAPASAEAPNDTPTRLHDGGDRIRSMARVPGSDVRRSDNSASRLADESDRDGDFGPAAELPKFSPISSDLTPLDRPTFGGDKPAIQTKLWDAFTPSRPKYSGRFFAGRRWALQRIITAVEQDQAHIVIFGPRGIGKTSLANVLAESASEVEYQVLRYPCGSNATFEEIFRGLLRSLPIDYLDRASQARFAEADNLEQLLPQGKFGPTDVTAILSHIKLEHAILIIDEFDRVENKKLKKQLAETIKNLSDVAARITFVVIGIAHSLDELIGMHPSIQRHLIGIHLPLMSATELEHVVLSGEDASGVRFEDATREMIVSFSKGLPYYAQLLCLHAGRKALERGSMLVQMVDLCNALEVVLRESDPLVRASYETATRDETDEFMIDVLFAAATAPFDDYGTFSAEDVEAVFVDSAGQTLPETKVRQTLDDLARQEEPRLIEKWATPTDETRYTFVLQTMRQYVLLRQAVRRGLM